MEEAFTAYLLGATGLTALVSNRIDWVKRPQGKPLPAIVLQKVDGAPVYSDEGESGLFSARIQVDCWAETYAAVKAVARQVMARLSATTESAFTQNNISFQSAFNSDEQDVLEVDADGHPIYRVRLDFIVWYR